MNNEIVNTSKFEYGILKQKVEKMQKILYQSQNCYDESRKTIDDAMILAKELQTARKELVDCTILFLSFPTSGIDGARSCIDTISQIDKVLGIIGLADMYLKLGSGDS